MEAWTQGFYVGVCTSLRLQCRRRGWPHRARLERAALRTPSPTPRVDASEDETTGRLGRTRRGISNKKLNWFECSWADEWYNNRIQRAVDAALEAQAMIKIEISRALTRVAFPDGELREEFNALWAGAKRLRYVTGHAGFSLMLDTMRRRPLAPKETWLSSAEFAEENGELLLVCQPRWRK